LLKTGVTIGCDFLGRCREGSISQWSVKMSAEPDHYTTRTWCESKAYYYLCRTKEHNYWFISFKRSYLWKMAQILSGKI